MTPTKNEQIAAQVSQERGNDAYMVCKQQTGTYQDPVDTEAVKPRGRVGSLDPKPWR